MHRKQITQEKTCIKRHVFKPIYKYKKNSVQAERTCTVTLIVDTWRREIPSIFVVFFLFLDVFFFLLFYKITRYIIPYSFSQQNEFYKL